MNDLTKNILIWVVIVFVLLAVFSRYMPTAGQVQEVRYSTFLDDLRSSRVESVVLQGDQILGVRKDKTQFRAFNPETDYSALIGALQKANVGIEGRPPKQPNFLMQLLLQLAPALLLIVVFVYMLRQMQGASGGRGAMSFGKSKARLLGEDQVNVTFADVAGVDEAKQEVGEIVDFLKDPGKFQKLGGKIPKGVLMVGSPGTGKTLLARAIAGEAKVPFFTISGSDFVEMFVGVGASRVRDMFEQAKKHAPCIIFIDEIDAVGRHRGAGLGGGHDEREQTLNQLLSEMDGFTRNDLTIILAATNRPDVLDAALLRPGRFDRRVLIDRPELAARRAILGVHTRDKPLGADVDLQKQAANTPGFSGADLANLVNEAALSATRRGAEAIEDADFHAAFDKIVLGDPRETKLDPFEKRRVAVHESGHTVVAHFAPNAEPPERVTIIPRGMALGVTQSAPGGEQHLLTRPQAIDRLHVMLGGYAAERVLLGDVSSGAEDDLRRATELAFKMVAHWGMSDAIGPVYHEHRTEHPFLGQMLATEGGTSDATVHKIEEETRRILHSALGEAEATLGARRAEMDALVNYLLEHESVDKTELSRLLGPGATRPNAEAAE